MILPHHRASLDLFPDTAIIATWCGDQRFDVSRGRLRPIQIDGSGREGLGPIETLLGALAAGAASDVATLLVKQGTPPGVLEVLVTAERTEALPRRLKSVMLAWVIAGPGLRRDVAERMIELALGKYSAVRASLNPDLVLDWVIQIFDSNLAPGAQ